MSNEKVVTEEQISKAVKAGFGMMPPQERYDEERVKLTLALIYRLGAFEQLENLK